MLDKSSLRNTKMLKLLSEHNHKLDKSEAYGLKSYSLNLAPGDHSGYETCPHRGACFDGCVSWNTGWKRTEVVRDSMISNTKHFFNDRKSFLWLLNRDLHCLNLRAVEKDEDYGIRPNCSSDVNWSKICPTMFDGRYNRLHFYDYTKSLVRWRNQDKAYSLTYSLNERSNLDSVKLGLSRGFNIAVVFGIKRDQPMPRTYNLKHHKKKYVVKDGRLHDIRLPKWDGRGNVIGLSFLGSDVRRQNALSHGFAV